MFVFNRNFVSLVRQSKNIVKSASTIKCSNRAARHLSNHPMLLKTFSTNPENTSVPASEEMEPPQENRPPIIDYEAITNGDKEQEYKLKVIMLETEVFRQEGHWVPDDNFITVRHWQDMLVLPSRSARKKYLAFINKISRKKEKRQVQKLENQKRFEEYKSTKPEKPKSLSIEKHALEYNLGNNNILLRIYDSTMNQMHNNRLFNAMQWGQKIVIDCGYDQNMSRRENYNCAKQLMFLFSENRNNDEPFDLHLCNINKESDQMKVLHKYIPTMYNLEFPLNTHENSYLDLFPKEKLVYLTPHCQEEMHTFDHDAVYIIGAIVDKINNEPLSLAKAKREGIKMAKFPLDKYLQWGAGSGKSLTLNQCIAILLDIKATGDWNYALRHVPKRKIVNYNTDQQSQKATNDSRFDTRRNREWRPKKKDQFDVRNILKE